MHHLGTVQIETDRLKLRKFNKLDSQVVFNNLGNYYVCRNYRRINKLFI